MTILKGSRIKKEIAKLGLRNNFKQYHVLPELAHDNLFKEKGINGLYSAEQYKMAWTDSQGHVLRRLNELTMGTKFEARDPLHTLKETARNSSYAPTFNYASLAFNNHFFLSGIKVPEESNNSLNSENEVILNGASEELKKSIIRSFGSLEEFRELFINSADAVFGNGFTWLVELNSNKMVIMNTYNAGTPFDTIRDQQIDLTGAISEEDGKLASARASTVNLSNIPDDPVVPLLNLSSWEFSFLLDYGLANKRKYIQNWWNCINWQLVEKRSYFLNGKFL